MEKITPIEILKGFAGKTPIGYPELGLGLNNQKLALFGLFYKAYNEGHSVVLPDFAIFDASNNSHTNVEFSKVYSVNKIREFARAFGMEIIDHPPIDNDNGWHCFIGGSSVLGWLATKGVGGLDDFACQFFRCLQPNITAHPVFKRLANKVFFEEKIQTVSQLRIEKDWQAVARELEASDSAIKGEYNFSFTDILSKTKVSLSTVAEKIYVVCDEKNLPVSKEDIRKATVDKFGLNLIWKSDILSEDELNSFSLLDLSIIDFEMAVRGPYFVGLSRSSFSNLANFEAFTRTGNPNVNHYVYNCAGPGLARRYDFGARGDIAEVTNKLFFRAPLIPETIADCSWPASLKVHFSKIGDFQTETGNTPGGRRSYIVCGVPGNAEISIEGFSLDFIPPMSLDIEYRAKMADNTWSDWVKNGMFVGSVGKYQAIKGFAVRLKGRPALSYEAICIASFVGRDTLIEARGEDGCFSPENEALEAMQIVFRPIKPDWQR